MRRPVGRRELSLVGAVALLLGTAPTVGDVGGCGATASDLDLTAFAEDRKNIDCQRCQECALVSLTCRNACDPNGILKFPTGCHPLQHDGDVCLRALRVASCNDYASFVDDVAPTTTTECDFCHSSDAGASGGNQ